MLHAHVHQVLRDRDARGARAVHHDLDLADLLAGDLERVQQSRRDDDGGAVLVVVEDRDIAFFLELALDLKAARRGDILQIDAAEGAADEIDGVDDLVHILALDAERERVHVAERLEQRAFALHDGHARLGSDVAQAQHGGAVGDDRDEVAASGQLVAFVDVLLHLEAGLRDAGGVGERQVLGGMDGNARDDLDLAVPVVVQL